jgi:hypothetical protein
MKLTLAFVCVFSRINEDFVIARYGTNDTRIGECVLSECTVMQSGEESVRASIAVIHWRSDDSPVHYVIYIPELTSRHGNIRSSRQTFAMTTRVFKRFLRSSLVPGIHIQTAQHRSEWTGGLSDSVSLSDLLVAFSNVKLLSGRLCLMREDDIRSQIFGLLANDQPERDGVLMGHVWTDYRKSSSAVDNRLFDVAVAVKSYPKYDDWRRMDLFVPPVCHWGLGQSEGVTVEEEELMHYGKLSVPYTGMMTHLHVPSASFAIHRSSEKCIRWTTFFFCIPTPE